MNDSSDSLPLSISPDGRAYAVIVLAISPLLLLWGAVWLRRGSVALQIFPLIVGLIVIGIYQLWNKTVMLDDRQIVQGWPPFRRKITYDEISRIHHIYVSSRYGSSSCLAISGSGKRQIVLPMKSFSIAKRRHLVGILKSKALQARIDHTVPA